MNAVKVRAFSIEFEMFWLGQERMVQVPEMNHMARKRFNSATKSLLSPNATIKGIETSACLILGPAEFIDSCPSALAFLRLSAYKVNGRWDNETVCRAFKEAAPAYSDVLKFHIAFSAGVGHDLSAIPTDNGNTLQWTSSKDVIHCEVSHNIEAFFE
eukprot:12425315-Karenia_brevis.AAC.1